VGAEIRSVLVVGAGAVGASVAGIISSQDPGAVSVLADAARRKRYTADGFVLNGTRCDFRIVAPEEGSEPDLVIVAVKTHQLARAIEDMRRHVGPRTFVLSLLNGIESEDALAEAFGAEKVLLAMILGIDAVREENRTVFSGAGKIHYGDASNPPGSWSSRVTRVAEFFRRTGVAFTVPEDMIRSLWFKFMINAGINQASAILRATYGVFQTVADAKEIMEAAMREVVELSQFLGTGLKEADVAAWYDTLLRLSPGGKTSMLQDIEARRKTEVDAFAGTVMRRAAAAGISVPVNRTFFRLIRAIESGF
jgi:2-dehydropantoate 2-reductase